MANYTGSKSGNQNFSGRILTIRILKYLKNITVRNLTFAGQVLRTRIKILTGTLASSGAYSYAIRIRRRTKAGVLSSAGYVTKAIRKILYTVNVVSFTGTVRTAGNLISQTVSGGLSFTGQAISKFLRQTYSGTITLSGIVTNNKARIRRLTFTGYISAIRVIKYLANQTINNLTFSGTSSASYSVWTPYDVVKDGIASFAGAINRLFQISYKTASGALTFAGTVYNSMAGRFASYSGAVSFAGSIIDILITTFYTRVKNRTVSFVGTLRRTKASVSRRPSGSLSFAKDITWSWGSFIGVHFYRTIAGVVSATGSYLYALTRQRTKDGVITTSGAVSRAPIQITRSTLGTLSISGLLSYLWKGSGIAYNEVTFSGIVTRVIVVTKVYAGSINFAGRVNRYFPIDTIGAGASVVKFAGAVSGEKTIEVMYYGVRCPS